MCLDLSRCFLALLLSLPAATNLFQGACTTNPASCLASISGSGAQTIADTALTAGTQYCVVCSDQMSETSIDLTIMINAGDCGASPVGLQSFSVESGGDF